MEDDNKRRVLQVHLVRLACEDKRQMKLVKSDYIIIAALILLIGAHTTTNYIVWHMQEVAEKVQIAESVVLEYEANPIARYFMSLGQFKFIFSYIIAPGTLIGLYYYIRNKYSKDNVVIESYSIAFLMVCVMDFLNDLSIALGMFL